MTDGAGGRRLLAPPPTRPVERAPAPTFSVIVAAYQAAGTIGEALASAFAQTLPPHEVIVCDDGSTDDLDAAVAPFRDRITLLRQPNRGEGAAKNAAAGAARGDFVVILDADDVYEPRRLEALGELATARPDLDVLTTNAILELDGAGVVGTYYPDVTEFPVEDQRHRILGDDSAVFGLAAVRRTRLAETGGFDESMPTVADWELWLRLVLSGSAVGLVDEPLARYRLRPDSLTADKVAEWRGCVAALERAARLPGLTPADRRVLRTSLAHYRGLALLTEAEAALRSATDARRLAARVLTGRGFGLLTRAKALGALVAPRAAARRLARREEATGRSRLTRSLPS